MIESANLGWFPQEYANYLFGFNGALALVAVLLLIYHMNQRIRYTPQWGQRLRFITLLAYAILTAYGSIEQISESTQVSSRHLVGITVSLLLIYTTVVSIREGDTKKDQL